MKDTDLISVYIGEVDFKTLASEMLNRDYDCFCNRILEDGFLPYSNFLSSAKDALTLKKFFTDVEKSNIKNKDYLSVLEIVLFISLIEGYYSDEKYEKMESYLKREFVDGMTKKQLKMLITQYQRTNSLSAKVRTFIAKSPYLDQVYLSSCFENDSNIKGISSSLKLLSVIVGKSIINQSRFIHKKNSKKIIVLRQLQDFIKTRKGKVYLSEFHKHFRTLSPDTSLQESIKILANQLYEIRSKFMHADEKRLKYSFFLDLEKGNIFDFSDIDFFRLFIRTLLLINNFELNVVSIASKEPL